MIERDEVGQLGGERQRRRSRFALVGQLVHVRDQPLLVIAPARDVAPGRAVLPQHPTSSALRNAESVTNMVDTLAPTRRA